MICPFCHENSELADWESLAVKCISCSCNETNGRKCPNCEKVVSHVWLDAQPEWRMSGNYKP